MVSAERDHQKKQGCAGVCCHRKTKNPDPVSNDDLKKKYPTICAYRDKLAKLDYEDMYLMHCVSIGIATKDISALFKRDTSAVRKRIRKLRDVFGAEYFKRGENARLIFNKRGRRIGAAADAIMHLLSNLVRDEHTK